MKNAANGNREIKVGSYIKTAGIGGGGLVKKITEDLIYYSNCNGLTQSMYRNPDPELQPIQPGDRVVDRAVIHGGCSRTPGTTGIVQDISFCDGDPVYRVLRDDGFYLTYPEDRLIVDRTPRIEDFCVITRSSHLGFHRKPGTWIRRARNHRTGFVVDGVIHQIAKGTCPEVGGDNWVCGDYDILEPVKMAPGAADLSVEAESLRPRGRVAPPLLQAAGAAVQYAQTEIAAALKRWVDKGPQFMKKYETAEVYLIDDEEGWEANFHYPRNLYQKAGRLEQALRDTLKKLGVREVTITFETPDSAVVGQ